MESTQTSDVVRPVVTRNMWKRSDEADSRDVEMRVSALERENAQLKEALELLLSGATEVTDNG